MKRKLYEKIISISFTVKGKNLAERISQVNEFLREFRRKLENVQIRDNDLFIRVDTIDEFASDLIGQNLLLCSFQTKWMVTDNEEGWAERSNNHIFPIISETIFAIEHVDETQDLIVNMENFVIQGEPKTGRWPKERIPTVGA